MFRSQKRRSFIDIGSGNPGKQLNDFLNLEILEEVFSNGSSGRVEELHILTLMHIGWWLLGKGNGIS